MAMAQKVSFYTLTIAVNAAVSNTVEIGEGAIVGILMSAAWTTANLTLKAAPDAAANVADVYDDSGTEVTLTAAASRFIAVSPSKLAGARFLAVRSGTTGTPVNQLAARTLLLVVRDV